MSSRSRGVWCMALSALVVVGSCSSHDELAGGGTDAGDAVAAPPPVSGPVIADVAQPPSSTAEDAGPSREPGPELSEPEVEEVSGRINELVPDVEELVRECVPHRVAVSFDEVADLEGSDGEELASSIVRGCERVVDVVDGWFGAGDRDCIFVALSGASQGEMDQFVGGAVDPLRDGGRLAEDLEGCVQ